MTNRDVENKLNKAISNSVPNVLDSILEECNTQKGKVIMMTSTRNNVWIKRFVGIAAALVIVAAGAFGLVSVANNSLVATTVSLDVNPSIEIQINKKDRVVDVLALNEEAKTVIGDMKLEGSDLDVAVNALIGSMLREGYINELANSILVSVDNDDPEKSAQIEKELSEKINTIISTDSFSGAVLSQTIKHEPENERLAQEYGITEGKAQLISNIIKADSRYTFEALAPLSINELNLLASSGQEISNDVGSKGTASEKKYIGAENAKAAALNHAGVTAEQITSYECELDFDDGVMVYEIEFNVSYTEYEYDINAVTGEVVKSRTDRDDTDDIYDDVYDDDMPVVSTDSFIGYDRAKEIALNHAGVSASDIRDYSVEFDEDNGVLSYEIEFESAGYDYSYDIHAVTGDIIDFDKDRED